MIEEDIQKVRKSPHQKFFDLKLTKIAQTDLKYFINQELSYYNAVVEQLNSRVKAFPQDIINAKQQIKLIEACAENGVNLEKFFETKNSPLPGTMDTFRHMILNNKGDIIIPMQLAGIASIGGVSGHLSKLVRKNIMSEAFLYVHGQAAIVLAGQKTEGLKAPVQMLQQHTLDTKRHLQIPKQSVTLEFSEKFKGTMIKTPYSKHALFVEGFDITRSDFNIMIIRSPLSNNQNQKWHVELKDTNSKYLLNLTDHHPRKARL